MLCVNVIIKLHYLSWVIKVLCGVIAIQIPLTVVFIRVHWYTLIHTNTHGQDICVSVIINYLSWVEVLCGIITIKLPLRTVTVVFILTNLIHTDICVIIKLHHLSWVIKVLCGIIAVQIPLCKFSVFCLHFLLFGRIQLHSKCMYVCMYVCTACTISFFSLLWLFCLACSYMSVVVVWSARFVGVSSCPGVLDCCFLF